MQRRLVRLMCCGVFVIGSAGASNARVAPETAHATESNVVASPPAVVDDFDVLGDGVGWMIGGAQLFWRTPDGGWTQGQVPPSAEMRPVSATFFDRQSGFLAGFDGDMQLSKLKIADTNDGGATWRTRAVVAAVDSAWAQAPIRRIQLIFTSPSIGWLSIARESSAAVSKGLLLATLDGGTTWEVHELPAAGDIAFESKGVGWLWGGLDGGQRFKSIDFGKTWVVWEHVDLNEPDDEIQIETVLDAELAFGNTGLRVGRDHFAGLWWVQSAQTSCHQGGCVTELIQRAPDGRRTTILSVWETQSQTIVDSTNGRATQLGRGEGISTGTGAMFDACRPPGQSALQAWWDTSPYSLMNIYGGPVWGCKGDAGSIRADYVGNAAAMGWRIVPTWVGPQSTCWSTTFNPHIDPNQGIAFGQGVAEGNAAADWVTALGLATNGSIVYYDVESYSNDPACVTATNALIAGWTQRLHERGLKSGVYGSPCGSHISGMVSDAAHTPDAVWLAQWSQPYLFRKDVSLTGFSCVSDTIWSSHQRMHQYTGGHNETWGGVTLNIDSSIVDAPATYPGCQPIPRTADQVILFDQTGFCGTARTLGAGNYANAAAMGFPNDAAVSIRVGSNMKAVLFRDAAFANISETIYSDDFNLHDNVIGDHQLSSLIVAARSGLYDPPRCSDGYEPDGTPAEGKPLPLGNVQSHTFCDTGDVDWVYADLTASVGYVVRASSGDHSSDTVLTLFAPDGTTQLAQNDDYDGLNARIFFRPAVAGRYRIRVQDASGKGSPTRGYSLSISRGSQYVFPLVYH